MANANSALASISRLEGKVEHLRSSVGSKTLACEELRSGAAHHERAMTVYSELSDVHVNAFCQALADVVNHVVKQAFGDYEVFFDVVGETGFRIAVRDGKLEDSVAESQGDGMGHVVSIACLLAALSMSPRSPGDILLLDEPFAGALQEDRLRKLYEWLSDAARELEVQVIVTTHHEAALEAADNVVLT